MSVAGRVSPAAVMSDEAVMLLVCARDDAGAFGELVVRWQQRIQNLCLRLTASMHDAEDAAQETFARAYAARSQFQGQAAFSTWLWRIALNATIDLQRKQRPRETDGNSPDDALSRDQEPSLAAEQTESVQAVIQALQQLPDDIRTVVVLRHYEGLKFREISDVLGVPQGTVCSRMTDGLNRLAVMLRPAAHGLSSHSASEPRP